MMRIHKKLIYGPAVIFLAILFLGGGCERDVWQDHISADDSILGPLGPSVPNVINWFGDWSMTTWWAQDENGEITEQEEAEEFVVTYNTDGTCLFSGEDGDLQATYKIDMSVTHSLGDDWWDGPWIANIDWDEGTLTWFFAEDPENPDGAGEGYLFSMEDGPTNMWYGEWTLLLWWAQDDNGETTEDYEHEGFVKYNENGTCEFKCFDDEFSGTYDFVVKVTHTLGDDWWDGPWYVTITEAEMRWFFAEDPENLDGAGEGYIFEKVE